MHRNEHAQEITNRFRELVEDVGDTLDTRHYDELSLLIEAGIDAALVDYMEMTATRLEQMAHEIRQSASFFDEE
jgi:gamma-glutamyl phosphate reductase